MICVSFWKGGIVMTIQEMRDRKQELGLSNEEISRRSGVPLGTLQKILAGKTSSPRQKTIIALERVLAPRNITYSASQQNNYVREPSAAYAYKEKKQGEYTLEDYYAIPDERRVELIDGVIYDMSAPSLLHQKILAQLHLQFEACIEKHESSCEVFLSPCDVQLDMDNRTMLQPDLFVVCRDYDRTAHSFYGAPDLTIEILSDSTRSKDMLLKLKKYHDAGVREYWIIDPQNKEVFVYDFTQTDFRPEVYPFDSVIPIHLSGDACKIDFDRINKKIAPHYA